MRYTIAFSALFAVAGCGTFYTPRASRSVRMIQEGGTPVFVKDGAVVQRGLFGDGLEHALADVPVAAEQARSFRQLFVSGLVTSLVGAGVTVAGALVPIYALNGNANSDTAIAAMIGVLAAGLIGDLIGVSLTAAAQPHLYDAINIYNDTVETPPGAPPIRLPRSPSPSESISPANPSF